MLTDQEIIALIERDYDLQIVQVRKLPGYEDDNYLITNHDSRKFTVKLTDNADYELLDAQAQMIRHLIQKGMKDVFPEYLSNKNGESITPIKNGGNCYLRILKFIPGKFVAEFSEHSSNLLNSIGEFLGNMDANLTDFHHYGARREFEWDIRQCLRWKTNLHHITNPKERRLTAYFLMQYKEQVLPNEFELRKAIIHNDANDWNVLVKNDTVCGLIDFGDIVETFLINNLAIALTYIMLDKKEPVAAAQKVIGAYHRRNKLKEKEVDLLYYLIAGRLCVSLIQSATRRAAGSANEHHFLTEKAGGRLLNQWIRLNPINVQQAFRSACNMPKLYNEAENYSSLIQKRNNLIGQNLSISYSENLKITRGAFQYLYDDQGVTYIDCVNNVSHVGHAHPTVVEAMQKQLAVLNTNTRYLNDALTDYAEALCAELPEELSVCYFTNSGSEANDLAVRIARNYTGQKDIIVLDHAYHGTSTLTMEMSPYKFDGPGGFDKPAYIHKAENPDSFRGRHRGEDAGVRYAEDVQRIIQELQKENKKPAAFICESLLGVGGQIPLPDNYLKEVYQHVRKAGGLVIADEVQVGFGRVGEAFWGFELQGVVPDMVVLGKPIGNGHPMAAVVMKKEIAAAFDNGMEYFNTFGGNPVSMITGLNVLKVIKEEQLQENALKVGEYLLRLLGNLQKSYSFIGDVRGKGLFIGVEFVKDRKNLHPESQILDQLVEEMKNRGFLLSTDGPLNNVLKIKPPLVFSRQNAVELVENLRETLDLLVE